MDEDLTIRTVVDAENRQSLIYGISLGWCCTAIGLAALYMSMQNELAYRDSLTGLYNQRGFESALRARLSSAEHTVYGLILKLDVLQDDVSPEIQVKQTEMQCMKKDKNYIFHKNLSRFSHSF